MNIKKILAGLAVAAIFAGYIIFQRHQTTTTPTTFVDVSSSSTSTTAVSTRTTGSYKDGTYTGTQANAYYGYVQVAAVIKNGAISNVEFLDYPSDRSTSREINNRAMSRLISEAIQAQSAQVDTVTGASDTSAAFRESLASALSQAR